MIPFRDFLPCLLCLFFSRCCVRSVGWCFLVAFFGGVLLACLHSAAAFAICQLLPACAFGLLVLLFFFIASCVVVFSVTSVTAWSGASAPVFVLVVSRSALPLLCHTFSRLFLIPISRFFCVFPSALRILCISSAVPLFLRVPAAPGYFFRFVCPFPCLFSASVVRSPPTVSSVGLSCLVMRPWSVLFFPLALLWPVCGV